MDDAVEESNSYLKRFIEKQKVKTRPINIDIKDSAELLIGKCDLSRRGYNRFRTLLTNNNVVLPTYNKVREFCTNLTVGEIKKIDCQEICKCMGVKTNLEGTIQQIISTKVLFETFEFFPEPKQKKIFEFLRAKNEILYKRHDSNKSTIFLRETGDNIGQCQSTSMYGCYHCQLPADKWANKNLPTFTAKNVSEQKRFGEEAKKVLGDEPNHSSVAFKNFQQKHYGQWVIVRFKLSFFFFLIICFRFIWEANISPM